ncbi:GNAT family N-acetyltransferase [[Clostridium] polysaccharolyticum]|uniref:Acetyltransferase (GNAT) family protein n=1 Tax=[Clostridium] polysaccharolyticum TaxID=29364 RepID=A0A1I0AYT2_9FIRM|nr:GNAT family N-acetyltransferase [[Clostridium] polysaccharolyticum]SES99614.1 Acetyltransferase (GNAT) family protein [[Clostridium] polysaccharolyticum]
MIYIRKAETQDASLLTGIKVRALGEQLKKWYGKSYKEEVLYEFMENELTLMKQYDVYKILLNHEIIGGFLLDYFENNKARIEDFVIDPMFQGNGYGLRVVQMMEKAHSDIKEWSLSTLYTSEDSQRFYERAGYIEEKRDAEEVWYRKVMKKE